MTCEWRDDRISASRRIVDEMPDLSNTVGDRLALDEPT
jgi:hypothetical protein